MTFDLGVLIGASLSEPQAIDELNVRNPLLSLLLGYVEHSGGEPSLSPITVYKTRVK